MKINSLKLANLRVIKEAEFQFKPGFNLIVGVNGVGKTSVLDALGVCVSAFMKQANRLRVRAARKFAVEDIRIGSDALNVQCNVKIGSKNYDYVIHKPRETSAPQEKKAGMPREQIHRTPPRESFLEMVPAPVTGGEPGGRPLGVLFTTNRAVPSEWRSRKSVAAGGISAAFAYALANRELRLGELADWMRVQETLRSKLPLAGRALEAFEDAVRRFLPGYARLRVDGNERLRLLIDHGDNTVPVRQMSDGERGVLALVLDLTRRLVQANPEMSNPVAEAAAIVLIDEIDLHLHPAWQRQIVQKLTATFPKCQFVATTHSPQVIGEVEHDRIHIIADGEVYSPTHSFGVDSSRVLEEIMDADPRTEKVNKLLKKVSQEIGKQQYKKAHGLLDKLIKHLGDNDPDVTRIRTLLDFMEGKE